MRSVLIATCAGAVVVALPPANAQSHTAPPSDFVIGGEGARAAELTAPEGFALPPRLIIVLDGAAPFLKVFTSRGELRQQLGRVGAGPGEFRAPRALAFDSATNTLTVLDPPNGRVAYYDVGDSLRLRTHRALPLPARGLCSAGGRLFVAGLHAGKILHEVAPAGEGLAVVRSFGTPSVAHPLSAHPMVQTRTVQGPLVCDAERGRAYAGSRSLGAVQLLSLADGTQRTVQPAGFRPVSIQAVGNGIRLSAPSDARYDEVVGLVPESDGVVVVTSSRTGPRAPADGMSGGGYASTLITYSGGQRSLGHGRWQVVGYQEGRPICYAAEPYPTVARFPAQRCP